MHQSEIQIFNGNCLEVLGRAFSEKVSAIITDLPYGTTDAKWDSIIPFDSLWEKISIVRTPGTPILLFGTEPFSSKLRLSNEKEYRYDWYWQKDKGSNFLFGNKQPMKVIECCSVFYQKQPCYNPQKEVNPKGISSRGKSYHKQHNNPEARSLMKNMPEKPKAGMSYEPDKLLPKCLVYFAREQRNKVHPTQKPVTLLEYLIKTYTNEGDTVLDMTMGSGSTGVACVNTGRNFVGIELDPTYFSIAEKRIAEAQEARKNLFTE